MKTFECLCVSYVGQKKGFIFSLQKRSLGRHKEPARRETLRYNTDSHTSMRAGFSWNSKQLPRISLGWCMTVSFVLKYVVVRRNQTWAELHSNCFAAVLPATMEYTSSLFCVYNKVPSYCSQTPPGSPYPGILLWRSVNHQPCIARTADLTQYMSTASPYLFWHLLLKQRSNVPTGALEEMVSRWRLPWSTCIHYTADF